MTAKEAPDALAPTPKTDEARDRCRNCGIDFVPVDDMEALERALTRLEEKLAAAERERDNLLARIFRDGGQHQATYATSAEACEAADALCVIYIHNADRAESLAAELRVAEDDTKQLDWLETQCVEVRQPARYGSRARFLASPDEDDNPSDLRNKIDAALSKGAAK